MPGNVIDGKRIGDDVRTELKPRISKLAGEGLVPGLAAVLVGENPASQLYVKMKGKASEEMGMAHWTIELPADVPEARLLQEIGRLNSDPKGPGILLQQPVPEQISGGKGVSA